MRTYFITWIEGVIIPKMILHLAGYDIANPVLGDYSLIFFGLNTLIWGDTITSQISPLLVLDGSYSLNPGH